MKRIAALGLLLTGVVALAADEVQYIIRIDGITCPFCIATSERALAKIEGVRSVHSDLDTGRVFVCADATAELSREFLAELFRSKGFTYRSVRRSSRCAKAPARAGQASASGREHNAGGH